jgi:hypothetical protein
LDGHKGPVTSLRWVAQSGMDVLLATCVAEARSCCMAHNSGTNVLIFVLGHGKVDRACHFLPHTDPPSFPVQIIGGFDPHLGCSKQKLHTDD